MHGEVGRWITPPRRWLDGQVPGGATAVDDARVPESAELGVLSLDILREIGDLRQLQRLLLGRRQRGARRDAKRHDGDGSGCADRAEPRSALAAAPHRHRDGVRQRLRLGVTQLEGDCGDLDREAAAGSAAGEVRVEQVPLELRELAIGRERSPRAGTFTENPDREPRHVHSDGSIGRKLGRDERFRANRCAFVCPGTTAAARQPTAILCAMSNRMKIALAVVAVAVAVIVTAVGLAVVADDPPSQAEYQTSVASARNRTDAALTWITKSQSSDELIARLADAAIVIDRAADDLADAGAPERHEQTNKQLVAALHELSTDLEGTAGQMQQPGFTDLLQGTRGLSFDSWTKVNALLADLRDDGVAVPALERH
jgi:hypothetical protein